jgi:succinoglycan biosynthesis transport protein ExoP
MDNNQLQPREVTPEPPSAFGAQPYFQSGYGSESQDGAHLRDYWNIIRKRKWWVIGFFFSIVLVVGVYTFIRTPMYRASAVLQIVQDNPQGMVGDRVDPLTIAMTYGDSTSKFYETQYKLLNSRSLAYKIMDTLNLRQYPEFKPPQHATSEQEIRNALAATLQGNLEINPIKNTFLVEVAYKSPNKELAQKIVNTVYKEYLGFCMETRQQSFALINEWLDHELRKLAQKVETSQRKLFAYGQKHDVLLEGEDNVVVNKFVQLNRLLLTAQADRMVKEAQFRQIAKKGSDASTIVNNPLIQKLRGDVINEEAKVSGIRKIFGKNYPQLQSETALLAELRGRLKGELNRTKNSAKADYEMAVRTEQFLQKEYNQQKAKVEKLQGNLVQHLILKRDLTTNEQLYQGLLSRMKEASAASTMIPSNAAVIEPAELPLFPYTPKKLRDMALATVIGLMGGIGLAFLVEYLDQSIKSTEDVDQLCRLPTLGLVPYYSHEGQLLDYESLGLQTFENPKSVIAESIHHVSTAVKLSLSGRPPAVIMMTSPNPSEGKTVLSVNLASALAMNGQRVIILDTDLRKPTVHRVLRQSVKPGLSNFLTGGASLTEIIQPTCIPNMFFISAGDIPPNPIQLLNSQAFRDLVKSLRQDFQHLFLDTPPVIGFADARSISSLVDGVILVFKHHSTSTVSGRLATQLLNQVNAPILGAILNMAKRDKLGYGAYYGYYKYYSKYYSNYSDEKM